MTKPQHLQTNPHVKTLIIGVYAPYNPTDNIDSYFDEFVNLVHSNGIKEDHGMFIKLRSIDPATFFTEGKLKDIEALCIKEHIEQVIISDALTTKQERNLSAFLQCEIIDRTFLILQIFERRATTAEGKVQVTLARLNYEKTRLAGRGSSMSQQAGGIGMRGPGETQKERELQHLEHLEIKLRRDLDRLDRIRETQRKQRVASKLPLICCIGYTNAGKSTIFNALTKSAVFVEDMPFATLETTTRELFINSKKKGLLSDTVGFIQQLPHHLIEAFKATLHELQYAHLLLQVVDISDRNWESHIAIVHKILAELEIDKPMLYVFNKIDKVDPLILASYPVERYTPHVLICATNKQGLQPLVDFLNEWRP